MSDIDAAGWHDLFAGVRDQVALMLADTRGRTARSRVTGDGAGGDRTTVIDELAERVVVAALTARHDATGEPIELISEELGVRRFGDPAAPNPVRVIVDPIDGSLNAKRGIPAFAFSAAVATGPMLGDVRLGYVADLAAGEVHAAVRGHGATLDGRPTAMEPVADGLEIVLLESANPGRLAPYLPALAEGRVHRIRAVGSLALAMCHVALGRADALVAPRAGRAVDIAAAWLLLAERGAAAVLIDPSTGAEIAPADAPLDLEPRTAVLAAVDAAHLAALRALVDPIVLAQGAPGSGFS